MTLHSKRLKTTIRIIAALLCCSSLTGCKFDYKGILESVTQLAPIGKDNSWLEGGVYIIDGNKTISLFKAIPPNYCRTIAQSDFSSD